MRCLPCKFGLRLTFFGDVASNGGPVLNTSIGITHHLHHNGQCAGDAIW